MTAIRCKCQGLPMGPGETCGAHQLPPGKHTVQLLFRVEVETSNTDPAAVQGVLEDIDSQVSGRIQGIRVKIGNAWMHVDYQVMAMHGQKEN